jgi:enoyl-CoA hydratase
VADLEVTRSGGVLRARLNRPRVHNAMTAAMSDDLAAALERAVGDDDVRVVVITGAGAAFCTGADVGGTEPHERLDASALDRANRIVRAVVALDQPVVAAVNGVAAGVGASIAFAADLAVAAESASFLLAFGRIGLMPDGGATATVAASIGRARAMRMGLLAEAITAREAHDAGLVSHLTTDEDFPGTVDELTARLLAGAPLAQAATKRAVNAATLAHLDDALERERTGQTILLGTADAAEGMRAFREKRRPGFRGS